VISRFNQIFVDPVTAYESEGYRDVLHDTLDQSACSEELSIDLKDLTRIFGPKTNLEVFMDAVKNSRDKKNIWECELTRKNISAYFPLIKDILMELVSLLDYLENNALAHLIEGLRKRTIEFDLPRWVHSSISPFARIREVNRPMNELWLLMEESEITGYNTMDPAVLANLLHGTMKELQSTGYLIMNSRSEINFIHFLSISIENHWVPYWRMFSSLLSYWKIDVLRRLYPVFRAGKDPLFKNLLERREKDHEIERERNEKIRKSMEDRMNREIERKRNDPVLIARIERMKSVDWKLVNSRCTREQIEAIRLFVEYRLYEGAASIAKMTVLDFVKLLRDLGISRA